MCPFFPKQKKNQNRKFTFFVVNTIYISSHILKYTWDIHIRKINILCWFVDCIILFFFIYTFHVVAMTPTSLLLIFEKLLKKQNELGLKHVISGTYPKLWKDRKTLINVYISTESLGLWVIESDKKWLVTRNNQSNPLQPSSK